MDGNKNSIIRMVLILMAVASVVLAAVQVVRLSNKEENNDVPQTDLSGYGSEDDSSMDSGDGVIIEDDGTLEMDSIPNGLLTSGSDAVSGTDAAPSGSDAE